MYAKTARLVQLSTRETSTDDFAFFACFFFFFFWPVCVCVHALLLLLLSLDIATWNVPRLTAARTQHLFAIFYHRTSKQMTQRHYLSSLFASSSPTTTYSVWGVWNGRFIGFMLSHIVHSAISFRFTLFCFCYFFVRARVAGNENKFRLGSCRTPSNVLHLRIA